MSITGLVACKFYIGALRTFLGSSSKDAISRIEDLATTLQHDPTQKRVFTQKLVDRLASIADDVVLNATLYPYLNLILPSWRVLINSESYGWDWQDDSDALRPDFFLTFPGCFKPMVAPVGHCGDQVYGIPPRDMLDQNFASLAKLCVRHG